MTATTCSRRSARPPAAARRAQDDADVDVQQREDGAQEDDGDLDDGAHEEGRRDAREPFIGQWSALVTSLSALSV
jgi:hypothetical protein